MGQWLLKKSTQSCLDVRSILAALSWSIAGLELPSFSPLFYLLAVPELDSPGLLNLIYFFLIFSILPYILLNFIYVVKIISVDHL